MKTNQSINRVVKRIQEKAQKFFAAFTNGELLALIDGYPEDSAERAAKKYIELGGPEILALARGIATPEELVELEKIEEELKQAGKC